MNYYVVVEGDRSEADVYPHWIKHINPQLKQEYSLADIVNNSFYLVSGHGYPNYLQIIKDAINDCNTTAAIDRLIIAVDSEEMGVVEKRREIESIIDEVGSTKDTRIIIQEMCFESWCLGNRKAIQRNPQNATLARYIANYNVIDLDPAKMPSLEEGLTPGQMAFKYLSLAMQEKGIFYSKANARYVSDAKYFFHLQKRATETNHIETFKDLVSAFS